MSREVPEWYCIYHVLDSGFSSPEQEANKTNYLETIKEKALCFSHTAYLFINLLYRMI